MNQNHELQKPPKNRYLKRMLKKKVFFSFCVGVRQEEGRETPNPKFV